MIPRGSKHPISKVSDSKQPYSKWILEQDTSNVGYLDIGTTGRDQPAPDRAGVPMYKAITNPKSQEGRPPPIRE